MLDVIDEPVPGEARQSSKLLFEAELCPVLSDEIEDSEHGLHLGAP